MSELSTGDAPGSMAAAFLNARVSVFYNVQSGFSDTGRISAIDGTWVELIKDNGERLLIPIVAIRILKIVEMAKRSDGGDMLLRPADGTDLDPPRKA